jgi:SAM-dependent methyltransferase
LWALKKFFPQSVSYLEVGCGTGFVLEAIARRNPELEVHGSEIFVEGLGFAKQRLDSAHLFQMDATRIPYSDKFDVIGAFDVIEHIENDTLVLQQMHRALRPGGGIILTVPQHRWLWSSQDEIAHHVRRYDQRELAGKVRDAGFRVAWTTSFVSLLLPAMAASRARKQSRDTSDTDSFSEFKLHRGLNAAMLKVMQFELALVKAGLKFPIGGSRILVAYRND